MSGSFPDDGLYVLVGVLFAIYLALRLNVIPRVGGQRNCQIFLLIFLCGAILLNVRIHYREVQRGLTRDKVLPTETSLRDLSQMLPQGTRVGYVSDIKRSERSPWLERYFLTQYAVSPRVLEEGTAPDWVIVNAVAYDPHLVPDSFVSVRDFGNGLMLFRREKK